VSKSAVKLPWYVFGHDTKLRLRWDLFIILLALWNCIYIPFDAAFGVKESVAIIVVDRIIDVFFFMDILFNFFTTFINPLNKLLVTDLKKIALHYILGPRFIVDVLATIPFDYLIPKSNKPSKLNTKVLGLMKMIRLLRLGRIITFMKLRSDFKIGFRIFQLLFFLLLLAHWIGCIWYLIVNDAKKEWIPPFDLNNGETEFFNQSTWD
jgi:hypothetical protein